MKWTCLLLSALAGGVAMAAATGPAQPVGPALPQQPEVAPAVPVAQTSLDKHIADLNSPMAWTRIDADMELRSGGGKRLQQIERSLMSGGLSAEQRARLESIARARFEIEPRAALGVSFDQRELMRNGAVIIEEVHRPFPAAAILRAGDRIEAIDGVRLTRQFQMRPIIMSQDPGDEVPISIVRDGIKMQVVVKLGDWSSFPPDRRDLNRALDGDQLEQAWNHRAHRWNAVAEDKILDPQVPMELWHARLDAKVPDDNEAFADADRGVRQDFELDAEMDDNAGMLVAAGEPHGGLGKPEPGLLPLATRGQEELIRQLARDRVRGGANDLGRAVAQFQNALDTHLIRKQFFLDQMQVAQRRLRDPACPAAEKAVLSDQIAQLRRMIQRHDQEIDAISRQIRQMRGR